MKFCSIVCNAAVLSALFALGGCSSAPPMPHQFENTRSYPDVSFDQGWENIIGFFANNRIPIRTIEKDSGVIYAETIRLLPNTADCGEEFEDWEDWDAEDIHSYQWLGKFNVYFRRGDPMTVTVNADLSVSDEGARQRCESTGVFEGMVLDAVNGT